MADHSDSISRGTFLKQSSGMLAAMFLGRGGLERLVRATSPLEHPDPRPGITAEHVLTTEALGSERKERVLAAYDAARTYPAVFDGLACGCGCTGKHGTHRSLLTCFETMQPTGCVACQEEAELVAGLAKNEATLAEIRAAVDKKYG